MDVYVERRQRLGERMREAGVDLLFVPPSGDLEYLTGMQRRLPTFGQTARSGSVFAGWGGACSGTGTCTVTMNAARSVTATFTR